MNITMMYCSISSVEFLRKGNKIVSQISYFVIPEKSGMTSIATALRQFGLHPFSNEIRFM